MRNKVLLVAIAGAIVVAGATMMLRKHPAGPADERKVEANAVQATLPAFDDAVAAKAVLDAGVPVEKLTVRSHGGVTILRGNADAATAQRAVDVVKSLGATRVANLITPARIADDEQLRRDTERELAMAPGLSGARLAVNCKDGVVVVSGKVQRELQKDLARETARSVRGVREVRIELSNI
jgi:osmotically-inducible protein OsmY